MLLEENLRRVEQNIEAAAERGEHAAEAVTLLAVSKTKPASAIRELYEAGQRDFGENYVQELREKAAELPKDIRWHMIGHLQRNKVKYIAEYVSMIHSVDSLALAETIEKEAAKYDRVIPILVEVNVAGEDTKFGVLPEDADALVRQISALPHVAVRGYMTSAPYTDTPEENRVYFRKLRELSVDTHLKNYNNVNMGVLSMGMSNDYEVAVEEGATLVRVGTSIFGARQYVNR